MRGPDAPIAADLRRAVRARRRRAFALCLRAWALTFVLAPAVHLWGHAADHHHLPDGTVVPHAGGGEDDGGDRPDPPHGDGGATHFAAAVRVAPPLQLPAAPALAAPAAPIPFPGPVSPARPGAGGLGARGPPAG